jgi:ABC-2 type transport system permease protein
MTATTTAPAPSATAERARPGALTGTGTLVRFLLRRDRVRLPAWAAGFGVFMLYIATALPAAYGSDEELGAVTQLFQDPVGRLLTGPGYGFDAPTLERLVAGGYGLYFLLLAALMSLLLVARHTRVEEQSGRAELVRANVVGRHAQLTATMVVAALTNLAAAVAVLLVMVTVGDFAMAGSLLFSAGVAVTGLAFAGVTAATVQLTRHSRAAAGLTGGVLGVAFLLRAGGDMAEEGGTWLSWLSPLAWGQQTAPFVLDRWWPLVLPLGFAALTTGAGYLLSTRRDLGASLMADRPGRPRAATALGTPLGLAFRLQRASLVGWAISLFLGGLVFGAYADALLGALADMPDIFVELFGGADDLVAGYLGYMAVFMAYLVGAFAILAVQGLRAEETSGRVEPVLAAPVSRSAWLGANLAVSAAGVLLLLAITGVGTGLGAALVTGDAGHVGDLLLAHLNQGPAVLVVLGLATLLFGLLPRLIPSTWALVGYSLFVGTFGGMVDLPEAAHAVSPFEHAAELPLEPVAAPPLLILTLLAAAATAIGLLAFRRRGIDAT